MPNLVFHAICSHFANSDLLRVSSHKASWLIDTFVNWLMLHLSGIIPSELLISAANNKPNQISICVTNSILALAQGEVTSVVPCFRCCFGEMTGWRLR